MRCCLNGVVTQRQKPVCVWYHMIRPPGKLSHLICAPIESPLSGDVKEKKNFNLDEAEDEKHFHRRLSISNGSCERFQTPKFSLFHCCVKISLNFKLDFSSRTFPRKPRAREFVCRKSLLNIYEEKFSSVEY